MMSYKTFVFSFIVLVLALETICDNIECYFWGQSVVFAALLTLVGSLLLRVFCNTRAVVLTSPHAAGRQTKGPVRVFVLNSILLPGGLNSSGSDDKKDERAERMFKEFESYDIVLLNECWGCLWSSYHTRFYYRALEAGFHVAMTPIGLYMNTGNVILSRFPIKEANTRIFKSTSGWQSIVPNGVLHAACELPSGEHVHCFTTHFQCTTSPDDAMLSSSDADVQEQNGAGIELAKALAVGSKEEETRTGQLQELKDFLDLCVPAGGRWLLGGDLNVEGGTEEYEQAAALLGRHSAGAPSFEATYDTHSFLTPPGWRGVDFNACLDHVFSNADVSRFEVVKKDLSDHHAISLELAVGSAGCVETEMERKRTISEAERGRNRPDAQAMGCEVRKRFVA